MPDPFAHKVWHVNAIGTSYAGAEQWNMGLWIGKTDGDAPAPETADANAIFARFKTLFATAGVPISWAFVLTDLKLQYYNQDGTMDKAATVFKSVGTPQAGQANRNVPPQLALAVSFRGAIPRGPGANGRTYLPGFVNIPTATGHIEANDITAVEVASKIMLDGINSDLNGKGVYLINASRGGKKPVLPPVNVKVTQMRIGDVVDTIQRRRRGLRESYRLTALA